MKVIKKPRLQVFCRKYPETEQTLKMWLSSARFHSWKSQDELLKTFPNAILIDKKTAFFGISKNNHYLLTTIDFLTQSICIQNIVRYYVNPNYNPSLN